MNKKSKNRGTHFFISHKLLKPTDVEANESIRDITCSLTQVQYFLGNQLKWAKTTCHL